MTCTEIIRMRDSNSSCTNKDTRCFFKPDGFTVEPGSIFNPADLGWKEDINCVTFAVSSLDPVGCGTTTTTPCVALKKNAASVLTKRTDGSGLLTVNFGVSTDNVVYRLNRMSDGSQVFVAQTQGSSRQITINTYAFPTGESYVLVVNRVGQSTCPATESNITLTSGSDTTPTGTWSRDGQDIIAL